MRNVKFVKNSRREVDVSMKVSSIHRVDRDITFVILFTLELNNNFHLKLKHVP